MHVATGIKYIYGLFDSRRLTYTDIVDIYPVYKYRLLNLDTIVV
jgi:hypothetical protein